MKGQEYLGVVMVVRVAAAGACGLCPKLFDVDIATIGSYHANC